MLANTCVAGQQTGNGRLIVTHTLMTGNVLINCAALLTERPIVSAPQSSPLYIALQILVHRMRYTRMGPPHAAMPSTPIPIPFLLQQNPTQQHSYASETFNRHNTLPKVCTTGVHAREGLT